MNLQELKKEVLELARIFEEECHLPFPYDDCRKIFDGQENIDFVMELSLFFSCIAGYSSQGKKILKWSNPQIVKARDILCLPFFEQHSEYKSLQQSISELSTPDLFEEINRFEQMRQRLFIVLGHLLTLHE